MIDVQKTLLSQYANSPIICSLIESMNEIIDPRYLLSDFYDKVLNVMTAEGWGLDVWARIVGVNRNAPIATVDVKRMGFDPAYQPFNTYPFSDGGKFSSALLPDEQLRHLIIIKAAANIIYATAPNINKFLLIAFGGRRAYYKITGHMAAEYVFEFNLDPFERVMVYNLNIMPWPCGVGVSYREVDPHKILGFNKSGLGNFNNGVFYSG